jgi:hypothetical protein
LCIELARIPDNKRQPEEKIWESFQRNHASWLGCLFDLLSQAISIKKRLKMSRLPRLADWGLWAAATYEAAGWGASQFMEDWGGNVEAQNSSVLDGSSLAQVILKFIENQESWTGTPQELLTALLKVAEGSGIDPKRDRRFPGTPDGLGRRIKEIVPLLLDHGVEVLRPAREKKGVRPITLRQLPKNAGNGGNAGKGPENQGVPGSSIVATIFHGENAGNDAGNRECPKNGTIATIATIATKKADLSEDDQKIFPEDPQKGNSAEPAFDPEGPCRVCEKEKYFSDPNGVTWICAICHPPAVTAEFLTWGRDWPEENRQRS